MISVILCTDKDASAMYTFKLALEVIDSKTGELVKRNTAFLKELFIPEKIENFGLSAEEKLEIIEKVSDTISLAQLKMVKQETSCPLCSSNIPLFNNTPEENFDVPKHKDNCITIQQATLEKAHAINTTLGLKDSYTIRHHQKVANLAKNIAKEVGLSEENIKTIEIAALLHDIGKICIPINILNKEGKLTQNEYSLIKTHVEQSYNILKAAKIPWNIPEIVSLHHERLNGSGYPKGFKEDDIPLETYVLIVADVFDAMISDRPYRKKHEYMNAYNEIVQNSNILYKDIIVKAFANHLNSHSFYGSI